MKSIESIKQALLVMGVAGAALLGTAGGASAYVVCNRFGDCWHTDSRVHFPHVRLSFHNDKWWERHRANSRYTWHEPDSGHDWHHGYWDHGRWRSL